MKHRYLANNVFFQTISKVFLAGFSNPNFCTKEAKTLEEAEQFTSIAITMLPSILENTGLVPKPIYKQTNDGESILDFEPRYWKDLLKEAYLAGRNERRRQEITHVNQESFDALERQNTQQSARNYAEKAVKEEIKNIRTFITQFKGEEWTFKDVIQIAEVERKWTLSPVNTSNDVAVGFYYSNKELAPGDFVESSSGMFELVERVEGNVAKVLRVYGGGERGYMSGCLTRGQDDESTQVLIEQLSRRTGQIDQETAAFLKEREKLFHITPKDVFEKLLTPKDVFEKLPTKVKDNLEKSPSPLKKIKRERIISVKEAQEQKKAMAEAIASNKGTKAKKGTKNAKI